MISFDHIQRMADAYVTLPHLDLNERLMQQFEREVNANFAQIPFCVEWVSDGQPFQTMGHMKRHAENTGKLIMYAGNSVLGDIYKRHRAVHDYFGHIVHGLPFGLEGEMACYRIHRDQYTPAIRPIIFSDVILANAYYEMNGAFYDDERYVDVNDQDFMTNACGLTKEAA
jgi:hypothetical protein